MSAFFVTRQTIHDVVCLWGMLDKGSRSADDLDAIGRRLWAMNCDAILQRYPSTVGTAEERDMRGAAVAYVYMMPEIIKQPKAVYAPQLAKSANCLLYQCSEGNIGMGNDLYDPLYNALKRLCDAVGEPKGYGAATWDRAA